MIKLQSLLLEKALSYIIVGCVDKDFNVIISNSIESHEQLMEKHGWEMNRNKYNFRFNGRTETIYWYQDTSDSLRSEVMHKLKEKYPQFKISKNVNISSNDVSTYNKLQIAAHGYD